MTDEEIEKLTALSRSRTEPASWVSRAQMLLAYRENPSRLSSHPSMARGSISSRASSQNSRDRSCAISGSPQNTNSNSALWPASTTSIATPSSTLGPTNSPTPPDMIRRRRQPKLVQSNR